MKITADNATVPIATRAIVRSRSVLGRDASRWLLRPRRFISATTWRTAWTMTGDIFRIDRTPAVKMPPMPM